ncbi:MAG: Gfo/Idh/MocA family oxidoreductase [Litoreibacter sp.]
MMRNPTRIAVVGFGLIGRRHVEVIRRAPNLLLAAIVEPSEQGFAAARGQGHLAFKTLAEMLEAVHPDGVVLATPTPLHLDQGLICVEARCPVLIEKPITVKSAEARQLIEAAERAGVALLVGHHRRHNGMVKAAKAALVQGDIGDIRAVQATCWLYKPDHYFEVAPWRTKKGAGPISVNLVHDVDLLRHFCGDVKTVQAISVPSHRGFENEDLATAIICFKSGAVATISVSDGIVAPWSWELTARENPAYPATSESCYLIGGSKGGMSLPDLRVWQHNAEPDWWTPIAARNLTCLTDDPLAVQMTHFAEVIAGSEAPLVSGLEGLESLEVVEAVALSSETGRTITIKDE